MKNLKQRLAKANGMNSMLCFAARDHINKLEAQLHDVQGLFCILVNPDVLGEEESQKYAVIFEEWRQKEDKKRWTFEDSRSDD